MQHIEDWIFIKTKRKSINNSNAANKTQINSWIHTVTKYHRQWPMWVFQSLSHLLNEQFKFWNKTDMNKQNEKKKPEKDHHWRQFANRQNEQSNLIHVYIFKKLLAAITLATTIIYSRKKIQRKLRPKTWNSDLNNEFNQVFWQAVALDSVSFS